jgi:transcriptional regulator with XRE-family HTH domain
VTAQEQLVADVKAAIRDSGTRQVWVAERLGISAKHLSQMLGGKAVMNIDWAEQILRLCGMRLALTVEGALPEPLRSSIECVLLDHCEELYGEDVDANLAELAFVYKQLTGWGALEEIRNDVAAGQAWPSLATGGPVETTPEHAAAHDRFAAVFKDAATWEEAPARRTEQDGGIPNDALTRADWDAATCKPGEAP